MTDFDGDGWPDVFFANEYDGQSYRQQSRLYRGGPDGLGVAGSVRLPTVGARSGVTRDPGNVYHRREEYLYVSSLHDAGGPAAAGRITWEAAVPASTSLDFQLRSAPRPADLAQATWRGPDGTDATWHSEPASAVSGRLDGGRYWQYRARFRRTRSVNGPILRSVSLSLTSP